MNLPDFFYIKQTRALNNLHNISVQLLNKFHGKNNPNNAYDAEWGQLQILSLVASTVDSHISLKPECVRRILSQKSLPSWYNQKPEMERDAFRIEVKRDNIEQELNRLYLKKAAMIGWIQTGLLLAILIVIAIDWIQWHFLLG